MKSAHYDPEELNQKATLLTSQYKLKICQLGLDSSVLENLMIMKWLIGKLAFTQVDKVNPFKYCCALLSVGFSFPIGPIELFCHGLILMMYFIFFHVSTRGPPRISPKVS